MPINIHNYLEMLKDFLNPEKWTFEIKPDKTTKKQNNHA